MERQRRGVDRQHRLIRRRYRRGVHSRALAAALAAVVGDHHVSTDPDVLAARSVDWTGRYRGRAGALVRPGDRRRGRRGAARLPRRRRLRDRSGRAHLAGGRHRARARRRAAVHRAADRHRRGRRRRAAGPGRRRGRRWPPCNGRPPAAGLLFGVDLAARDSATIGGMAVHQRRRAAHRALRRTWREQVLGLEVALPDGSVVRRHAEVRSGQHRIRPDRAVRRRRGHPRGDHRRGPATAPDSRPPGDRGVRVRRPRRTGRRRTGAARHRHHRRTGTHRRPGRRAGRRAPRRAGAGGRRLAAAGRTGRRQPIRPTGWQPRWTASAVRASPPSESTPPPSSGCGSCASPWPRWWACSGRR